MPEDFALTDNSFIPYAQLAQAAPHDLLATVRRIEPGFGLGGYAWTEGSLTEQQLRQASGSDSRRPSQGIRMLIAALVLVSLTLVLLSPQHVSATFIYLPAALLISWGVLMIARRRRQKQLQEGKGPFERRVCLFATEGVVMQTDTTLNINQWSVYQNGTVTNTMVMLQFANSTEKLAIPQAHCKSPADWERLCALVADHLPKR